MQKSLSDLIAKLESTTLAADKREDLQRKADRVRLELAKLDMAD